MTTFALSQRLLVSAGAAALGCAGLLTLLAGNAFILADAGANAGEIPPLVDPDFPICHTAAKPGLPNMMLRLHRPKYRARR